MGLIIGFIYVQLWRQRGEMNSLRSDFTTHDIAKYLYNNYEWKKWPIWRNIRIIIAFPSNVNSESDQYSDYRSWRQYSHYFKQNNNIKVDIVIHSKSLMAFVQSNILIQLTKNVQFQVNRCFQSSSQYMSTAKCDNH